ncbi:MAG: GNAT family N-acetyltransferase [Bacteroidota bacterium]
MIRNSDSIRLRVPEPADIETLLQWENNQELWHAGQTNIPFSRFAMEQFILDSSNDAFEQKQVRFIIEETATKKSIGTVDLFDINALHRRAAVGIMIVKPYRKQGFAKAALEKIEDYAFHDLWLQQIYATLKSDNPESMQLFLSFGFEQTGTKKAWIKTPNRYLDELFMQKLNPYYHEQKKE